MEQRISDTQRQRPDLRIDLEQGTFWVDVAVAHPCARSRKYARPLAAASDAENKKVRDYGALALQYGATFLPFALESYGAFGARAREVMKVLRKQATENAVFVAADFRGGFASYATQKIAVALQKGNAAIARRGAVETRMAIGGRKRP